MTATVKPQRTQILHQTTLVLAGGATWWQTASLAANPVFSGRGQSRVKGAFFSSVAPGSVSVQFSPDGTNFDRTVTLTADPSNASSFPFDLNLTLPYFRFVLTDAGAGSTVRLDAWLVEDGAGADVVGGGSTPVTPSTLPLTYRVAFDGIVFASAGGQFLEISNPVASGRVLRATFQMFCKPSVNVQFKIRKQSAASTGGVATTPTPVPLDSTNAATVGVVKLYTTAPTNGASPGNLYDAPVWPGDTFVDPPNASQSPYSQLVTIRAGESVGWQSDVAFTADGVLEFTEAAS